MSAATVIGVLVLGGTLLVDDLASKIAIAALVLLAAIVGMLDS